MMDRRLIFCLCVVMLGMMVLSTLLKAQVSIKERIAIQPRSLATRQIPATDSGVVWLTPSAGTISVDGGTGSEFECSILRIVVLEPLHNELCNTSYGAHWDLPGNWKAGTRVTTMMWWYPYGERGHEQFTYPDSLAHSSEHDVRFVYPGLDDPGHSDWDTRAHLTLGSDLDHFLVQFNPDTIAYRDTSQITVTAVDAGNQEVSLGGNTLLTFTLDSTAYGQFINPSGQLVSSPLSNVSYSDARAGNVKFFANGARDTVSVKAVSVRVDGAQKTGSNLIYLGNIRLNFVDKSPRKLWPYIDTPDRGANRPGYKATRGFVIQVMHPNGQPLPNKSVWLQTSYVPGTGGHGHVFSHDTIMIASKQAKFWSQGISGNPLSTLVTNSNGQLIVDSMRASPFSGTYWALARLNSDTTIYDSVLFNVRVDSLVQLGAGSSWVLTGVPGKDSLGMNHTSNHWCTPKALDSLTAALNEFAESENEKRHGQPLIVGVNDMSLETGGDFDIRGGWIAGIKHEYHRVGLSVDIDRVSLEGDVLKDTTGVYSQLGNDLIEIMSYYGASPYDEPTIHFGFDHGR